MFAVPLGILCVYFVARLIVFSVLRCILGRSATLSSPASRPHRGDPTLAGFNQYRHFNNTGWTRSDCDNYYAHVSLATELDNLGGISPDVGTVAQDADNIDGASH